MEGHIYNVKAKSQAGNISQRYNDNTKRPKPQDTLLEILKTYAFYQKIQHRASGLGKSVAGVSVYENIAEKLPKLYFVVQGHSWHANTSSDVY